MAIRFSLQDAKDREFLESRGVDLKALVLENKRKAALTLASMPENRLDEPEIDKKTKKYRNVKAEYRGMKFDSQFELACWQVLEQLQREGKITSLKRQVSVTFTHNGIKLMACRPDFYFEVHIDEEKTAAVYADAKSPVTAKLRPFKIAQNMFRAFYGYPMLVFTLDSNIEEMINHRVVGLT